MPCAASVPTLTTTVGVSFTSEPAPSVAIVICCEDGTEVPHWISCDNARDLIEMIQSGIDQAEED